MPSYLVNSGIEIPMTNDTFDFIWNGLGNKELIDTETSSLFEEGTKPGSSGKKTRSTEWKMYEDRYFQQKTEK